MISFSPSEDQALLVTSVAQLARAIRPRIREFEAARALPADVRKAAHALGLGVAALPEAAGGAGLGMTTAVLLEEELAYGDPAAGFALGGPGAFGIAVSELGTPEQALRLLAPFVAEDGYDRFGAVAWGETKALAERPGFATRATRDREGDGWQIDGAKEFVVGADRAEAFVVFAQVDDGRGWGGLGAFVVPRGAKGLTVTPRVRTLGLDAASFGGIRLDGVHVRAEDQLGGGPAGEAARATFDAAVLRFFAKSALIVAARAVGLARAAFDVTRDYCETRRAFGKPIGHFQAVAFTVADRAMDLDAARGLVWRAAAAWDHAIARATPAGTDARAHRDALLATAQAVGWALDAAMKAGDDAVQLHGGAGFMRDYPAEKYMRDAKQLQVCAMTAEHADQLAAAIEVDRPLDLGLVLPTGETQNVFL